MELYHLDMMRVVDRDESQSSDSKFSLRDRVLVIPRDLGMYAA